MTFINNFDSALYGVSDKLKGALIRLPFSIKNATCEIRIRKNMPLALTVGDQVLFVDDIGNAHSKITGNLLIANESDIGESFSRICGNSVYAHEEELKNGFVIMKNGCRAGVSGEMNKNGIFKRVNSINIRIAKQVLGCADEIIEKYEFGGLLIAGPPASGKTTVLRDFVRQLSNGVKGSYKRIAVVDSRGEISGGLINDLGVNTDVLVVDNKALGVEIALRTLFPEIIAFDEISTTEELKRVSQSFYAGVSVIATAHITDAKDLSKRYVTDELIKSGAISQIALLPKNIGGEISVISLKEYNNAANF